MQIKCTCKSPYQDGLYGLNIRIGNPTKGGSRDTPIVRCTVCGSTTGGKK